MKVTLAALLLKLGIDPAEVTIIEHQGVQELEASLPRKLRAWHDQRAKFLVLRDNDNGDCHDRKQRLSAIIDAAGRGAQSKVRIVCQELEAWFIGDVAALQAAGVLEKLPRKFATQAPDVIAKPSEVLRRVKPGYGKIAGAQAIAPHLEIDNNRSMSFHHAISAIRQLMAG
jgi:hypothetical protein